jgi:hypothetical protein
VLAPPDDLPEAVLASALRRWWGLTVATVEYRPLGWGSHHWDVTDAAGSRWFVTADDLEHKRLSDGEPLSAAFGRLRASLAAATDLRDCGRTFVVAPVPAGGGEPLARASDRFAVAVYPFVDGRSFEWGAFSSPGHRLAVLALIAAVHTAPASARRHARTDDFAVPHRDGLEAACGPPAEVADCGPYARPAARLLLARYDNLVREARARPGRAVLTHGEPHPGNTTLTAGGWVLIDWDTALLAPPERDLWHLEPGEAAIPAAYERATGVSPLPPLLDLYRLRWDITDIAIGLSRFRRPHAGTVEDDKAWDLLGALVARVSQEPAAG